jgi:alpha-1,6-mannosyltransferase
VLAAAVVSELALLHAARHSVAAVSWVIVAAAFAGSLVLVEHRDRRLSLTPVALAIAIVMSASVVMQPRTSNDLWSYTMYGRMVTVHHASPYDHAPADFPHDPFVRRVSGRWVHRASVYGPVFVGVASLGTLVAGDSALLSRLFFQILAALALVAVLAVVWRTTRNVAAIIFLGLNPVLAVIVVNGGHNDAWLGLAILLATLAAGKRRFAVAGLLIGLAALVKLTALLALIGLALWAWRHRDRRGAVVVTLTSAAVVIMGYLPVVASASHVLGDADHTVTQGSPWDVLVDRLLHHDAWRIVPHPLAPNDTLTTVFVLASLLVLVLAVGLAWLAGRDRRSEPAVGVAVAAYPVAAEYAYPWYAAWGLPVFAGGGLTALSAVVWLQSVLMLAALKLPLVVHGPPVQSALRVVLTQIAPPLMLVAFVVVALRLYPLRARVDEPVSASVS